MIESKEERFATAMGAIGTLSGIGSLIAISVVAAGTIFSISIILLYGPGIAAVLGGISSFTTYYGWFRILQRKKKLSAKEEGGTEAQSQLGDFIQSLPELFKSVGCFSQIVTVGLGASVIASAIVYTPLKEMVKLIEPIKPIKPKETVYYSEPEPEPKSEPERVVEAPIAEISEAEGKFVIQVTLANTEEQAGKIVEILERNGVDAYVARVKDPAEIKGVKYRVRVGDFRFISEAKAYATANITPLGYKQWYIDNKSNDNIGKPIGYKPPEQAPSLPVVVEKIPEQAPKQVPVQEQKIEVPPPEQAVLETSPPEVFLSPVQSGDRMVVPPWLGKGLVAAGLGVGIYGLFQNGKYGSFYKDFKTAKSVDEEKASEQKAEEAKQRRDIGYTIGSALLASGLTIYIIF